MISRIHMRDQVNNRVERLTGKPTNHRLQNKLYNLGLLAVISTFLVFADII